MVNFKLLIVLAGVAAFVAGGGISFTKGAIGEAKKLKDELLPSSAKPKTDRINRMTQDKLRDEKGGINV